MHVSHACVNFAAFVSAEECTPGDARLVNGTRDNEGVLEVCTTNSDWSTVCSRYFGCNEQKVACRRAGFADGTIV